MFNYKIHESRESRCNDDGNVDRCLSKKPELFKYSENYYLSLSDHILIFESNLFMPGNV